MSLPALSTPLGAIDVCCRTLNAATAGRGLNEPHSMYHDHHTARYFR
jgi:hypothetical protein